MSQILDLVQLMEILMKIIHKNPEFGYLKPSKVLDFPIFHFKIFPFNNTNNINIKKI